MLGRQNRRVIGAETQNILVAGALFVRQFRQARLAVEDEIIFQLQRQQILL